MTREILFDYAENTYGSKPEYLWESSPKHAVLRNKTNLKWYAIVMRVKKETLGLQGSGEIDIVNVKCNPLMIGSLRLQKGFLPAYHMNKANWISIILENGAPDNLIIDLIDFSYELVSGRYKHI